MPLARDTITQLMMLEVKILAGGGKVQGARFLNIDRCKLASQHYTSINDMGN